MIHRTAMWIRLGFSQQICKEEKLSSNVLECFLAHLHWDSLNEELKRMQKCTYEFQKRIVQHEGSGPYATFVPKSVDLAPTELRQFISNTYLTDEAAIALLRIIERTCIRYFSLSELVQWLEKGNAMDRTVIYLLKSNF